MMEIPPIDLSEYLYTLPDDRIARHPLAERDKSKLMVWKAGQIAHSHFSQITDFLSDNSILFFNNTKVIPARLLFEKETGGIIEVFLLNPADGTPIEEALQATNTCTWSCTVGNSKRWPEKLKIRKFGVGLELTADLTDRASGTVTFSWSPPDLPFVEVVEQLGAVPLPPYLKRAPEVEDKDRYQTVYSSREGAVAAPTAGLHFTPAIMEKLRLRGITEDFLTLHVSAGTFVPIKVSNAVEHPMHKEEIVITKSNIINMLDGEKKVIAVGTTALRTLESVYWYGYLLSQNPEAPFDIPQYLPYQSKSVALSTREALDFVLKRMERSGVEKLIGHTSIYVIPGYRFRVTKGLLTNFHQPGSTLLLLVSAFTGHAWKAIYDEALSGGYRFLSYGDSSLLLPVKD